MSRPSSTLRRPDVFPQDKAKAARRARAIYGVIQGLKDAYPQLVVFAIGWNEDTDEPIVAFIDVDPSQDAPGA